MLFRVLVSGFVGVLVFMLATSTVFSSSDRQAGLLVITNWNDNCFTDSDDLPNVDNLVGSWYNEIRSATYHCTRAFDGSGNVYKIDGWFKQDYLTDVSFEQYGDDVNWLEPNDAVVAGFHGGMVAGNWRGKMRRENANGECDLMKNEMQVGDGDTENLILMSCNSMRKSEIEDWEYGFRMMFDGMHVLNGFHGRSYTVDWLWDDWANFADDGFDMSVRTAFIDNLYESNAWVEEGILVDQCPVAMSAGASVGEAMGTLNAYDYYSWGSDPTGNSNYYAAGVSGCLPWNGGQPW